MAIEETNLSPRSRDFYNGFDGLKAHVPICLLRQICQKIIKIDPISSSIEMTDEKEKTQSNSIQIQRFYGALMFVDISGIKYDLYVYMMFIYRSIHIDVCIYR
jgi:hypothetical protein